MMTTPDAHTFNDEALASLRRYVDRSYDEVLYTYDRLKKETQYSEREIHVLLVAWAHVYAGHLGIVPG